MVRNGTQVVCVRNERWVKNMQGKRIHAESQECKKD